MRRRALLAVAAVAWLTGCASLQPNPESTTRPLLPMQFDPPLPGAAAQETLQWWARLHDPQLDGFMARALGANRDLRTASTRIAEVRALTAMVDARLLPQIGAGGAGAYVRLDRQTEYSGPWGATSPRWDRGGLLGLDASWDLDVFGAVARRQDAANAELESAVANSGAVAVMVAGEVASTYIELRAAQALQATLREQIEIARGTEQLIGVREQAGLATELDRLRATAQLRVTAAALPLAEARAELATRQLGVLVGGNSQTLLAELALPRPLPVAVPALPAAVPGALLERRPDLIVAQRQWQAALARVAGAEADRLPTVSLGTMLGLLSISGGNLLSAVNGTWNLVAIAAMLRAPLYAPGLVAATQLERSRADAAAVAYERAAVAAVLEVEQAMLRLARSLEREAQLHAALAADVDALGLAQVRYERGLTDFLAVLDVMRSRNQVEQQWVEARAQTFAQYVALNKALGGGWESVATAP